MFNFLKRNKEDEQIKNDVFDITALFEQLEYLNSYVVQLNMVQGEILKQQTIANALAMLDQQYRHADGFMKVDEIKEKYLALAGEIFSDYHEQAMEKADLNNLENKD